MAAYVISDVEFLDEAAVAEYRRVAQASIARHSGRYLVRGGAPEAIEGSWQPRQLVIVEFPSMAQARAWYASSDYAEALVFRDRALRRNLVFVDGVPPS